MMKVLTSTPATVCTFTKNDLKDFYKKYVSLENVRFAIRSCAAEDSKPPTNANAKVPRIFCCFESGITNERLGFCYRPEVMDMDEELEFKDRMNYLNASRHGGDACKY
jgi:hypothetical protein